MMRRTVTRKQEPKQLYRVEGIGRRGVIRYVKVVGSPGLWKVFGLNGLRFEVAGRTIEDAVRMARRRLPFRPMVIRPMASESCEPEYASVSVSPAAEPCAASRG